MLKLNQSLLTAIGLLLIAGSALAADYKIGYVQAVRVLEAAPQAEVAKKKLESEFAGRDKQLLNDQKALKTLEDRLAKDAAIMSETERSRLERDIKRNSDEFREDVNFRRNEEFGKIQRQIVEAIRQLAEEQKFDVVLGEGVIFASKAVDITDQVIALLKK
jgi:outer membrane protein